MKKNFFFLVLDLKVTQSSHVIKISFHDGHNEDESVSAVQRRSQLNPQLTGICWVICKHTINLVRTKLLGFLPHHLGDQHVRLHMSQMDLLCIRSGEKEVNKRDVCAKRGWWKRFISKLNWWRLRLYHDGTTPNVQNYKTFNVANKNKVEFGLQLPKRRGSICR